MMEKFNKGCLLNILMKTRLVKISGYTIKKYTLLPVLNKSFFVIPFEKVTDAA